MWAYKQQLPQNNVRRWQARLWTQRLLTPKGTAEHRQPTEGGEIIASCYWPFIWRLYKVQNSTLENQISQWASPWLQQTLLKRSTSNSTENHSPSSAIREWKSALSWESISPNQSGHSRGKKTSARENVEGPLKLLVGMGIRAAAIEINVAAFQKRWKWNSHMTQLCPGWVYEAGELSQPTWVYQSTAQNSQVIESPSAEE